jgi:hypothetical protein
VLAQLLVMLPGDTSRVSLPREKSFGSDPKARLLGLKR